MTEELDSPVGMPWPVSFRFRDDSWSVGHMVRGWQRQVANDLNTAFIIDAQSVPFQAQRPHGLVPVPPGHLAG